MIYVALGVIGFGSFLLLCKLLWSNKVPSKNTRIVLFASIALVVVLGTLVLLSKFHPLAAFFTILIPYLRVLWGLLTMLSRVLMSFLMLRNFVGRFRFGFKSDGTDSKHSDSETQTSELAMKLNHETGTMTGAVLAGEFKGRDLDSLSDEELHQVYKTLREEESKRLLEAYVGRHRPHLNETASDTNEHKDGEKMSVKRAADILGVDVHANKEDIVAAHRRLMDKLHPDKGGTSYLAAELNEAKQVLLGAQS